MPIFYAQFRRPSQLALVFDLNLGTNNSCDMGLTLRKKMGKNAFDTSKFFFRIYMRGRMSKMESGSRLTR